MTVQYLPRPEGRLAYTDAGSGPLVVCVPGVGDIRAEYRELEPRLLDAGYRVVVVDLPGHGDSDTTFSRLDRPAVGDHLTALVDHLGAGPAHLIGCSLGASAAAWTAATAPDRVTSLTLIGPFVRDPSTGLTAALVGLAMRLALARPWGPRAWAAWHGKLHPGRQPADLAAHRAALRANLAQPGRLEAMRRLATSSAGSIEARLDDVVAPTLVVMGTADPDFPDATAEAAWIAERLHGELVLADGAGHYPHVEQPEVVGPAVAAFLARATSPAG